MTTDTFAINQKDLEEGGLLGETIVCDDCGEIHTIKYGHEIMSDGTKVPSKLLAFYNCKDRTVLAGIRGHQV
jgi:hypothetical protein